MSASISDRASGSRWPAEKAAIEKVERWFTLSAGIILALTGAAKVFSTLGHAGVLGSTDPVFGMRYRHLMLIVGAIELVIAAICFSAKQTRIVSLGLVGWLATSFALYRLGLWLMKWPEPCACLGHLTDSLGIPAAVADSIGKTLLAYLLIGSYFFYGKKLFELIQSDSARTVTVYAKHLRKTSRFENWVRDFILICTALLWSVLSNSAAEYRIEGVIETQGYRPDRPDPAESKTATFQVAVRGCLWNIRVKERDNPNDFYETGTDGTNIYSLIALAEFNQRLQASGKDPGVNSGSAFVEPGPVPHNYWSPYISVLWLAFASSCYFDSLSNSFAEPLLFFVAQDRNLHKIGFQQRVEWDVLDPQTFLPSRVAYFDSGKKFRWREDVLVGYVPPTETQRSSPFDKGFTNSLYAVLESTNIGAGTVPLRFAFEVFHPKQNAASATNLHLVRGFFGVVTSASIAANREQFLPAVPGMVTVADERFRYAPESVPRLEYLATNRWLTDQELTASALFKQHSRIEAKRKPALIAKAEFNPRVYRFWALVALAICAALFPVSLWLGYKRKHRTVNEAGP